MTRLTGTPFRIWGFKMLLECIYHWTEMLAYIISHYKCFGNLMARFRPSLLSLIYWQTENEPSLRFQMRDAIMPISFNFQPHNTAVDRSIPWTRISSLNLPNPPRDISPMSLQNMMIALMSRDEIKSHTSTLHTKIEAASTTWGRDPSHINVKTKSLAKIHKPARSRRHEDMQAMPIPAAVAKRKHTTPHRNSNPGFETAPILSSRLCNLGIQLANSNPNRFSQLTRSSSATLRWNVQRAIGERRICEGEEGDGASQGSERQNQRRVYKRSRGRSVSSQGGRKIGR